MIYELIIITKTSLLTSYLTIFTVTRLLHGATVDRDSNLQRGGVFFYKSFSTKVVEKDIFVFFYCPFLQKFVSTKTILFNSSIQ